jgi:hypothetical protein
MQAMSTDAHTELQRFESALAAWRRGDLSASGFAAQARQPALLAALPPAFGTVLHDLLDRLETGALFTEESCSFSHEAIATNLGLWADKARARLGAA